MRAVVYSRHGRPEDVLRTVDVAEPGHPGHGEVLIRVTLRPVHHGDLLGVAGRYATGAPPPSAPVPVGFEGYGVVEQAGPGSIFRPGARVAFFPGRGAWGEKVLLSEDHVTPIPDAVTDAVAAQLHVNPLTTALLLRAVDTAGARPGTDVIVLSAAGSAVARLTITLLLERGYDVIALVRREAGVGELNLLFPDLPVIATDEPDWARKVLNAAAGNPIRVILDPVGGATASTLISHLEPGGALVSYGDLSGEPISVPALAFSTRNISIFGVSVGSWASLPSETRQRDLACALDLATRHADLFPVAETYDLSDVAQAVAHVTRPGRTGSVLLASP